MILPFLAVSATLLLFLLQLFYASRTYYYSYISLTRPKNITANTKTKPCYQPNKQEPSRP